MKDIKKTLKDFLKDESAQGMVEYILILAAVIGLVIVAKKKFGEQLEAATGKVDDGLGAFSYEQ